MTESDRIIAEVLRLDAEATKGPWVEWNDSVHAGPVKSKTHGMLTGSQGRVCNCHGDDFGDDDEEGEVFAESNAELIASYRTSAPRLARMLKMHQELTNGIVNGTQPPWLDEAKKLKETRPYESLESKAARYVLNKCDEIAKGEA